MPPRQQFLHTDNKETCFLHAEFSGRTADATNILFIARPD